ncbi:hypothetical protein I350_05407 [Cryptococcus amylolentus CBS 6273]|uniref:Beta-lactamase-related domain-containing protein n=1 Tax=Cryptococcus amylolentus CBS 6273 TaxID=1296118 RepID=A0A1E3JX93_9TREE|nr:hypothetical protein I350_05407 [Cryptococcus amylolentus CBS 6273]
MACSSIPYLLLLIAVCLVTPSLSHTAHQQPLATAYSSHILDKRLCAEIDELRERWGVKGITLGVAASPNFTKATKDGAGEDWTSEVYTFGKADRYENDVDNRTLFGIASNSKVFVAISIGLLIEDKTYLPNGELLDWSTKIKDILPGWGLMDDYASTHADLIDLLTKDADSTVLRYRHQTPEVIVSTMRYLRPSAELRQAWQYNNFHYIALDLVIQTLTNRSLSDFVQSRIFDPVGLQDATYNATQARLSGHRSDGFVRLNRNYTQCTVELDVSRAGIPHACLGTSASIGWWVNGDGSFEAGPGGIIMSGSDMAKWTKELLDPRHLPAALVDKLTVTYDSMYGKPQNPYVGIHTYGLGQWVYTYRGFTVHGHDGSLPGQHSTFIRLPDIGFGFFLAINDDDFGTPLHRAITNIILDKVLGLDYVDWERQVKSLVFTIPEYPDVPINPREAPAKVAGRYTDSGYGNLDLKQISHPAGPFAAHILETVSLSLTSAPLNITGPIYLAEINKTFASHIILTHFDGPLFNITLLATAETLSQAVEVTRTAIKVEGYGTAVVQDAGVGIFGNIWGKGNLARESTVTEEQTVVKKAAEIWFDRVG